MLHEPGAVGLDRGQGVQVAEQVEGDLGVAVGEVARLGHEGVEHQPLHVRAGRADDVVLDAGEDLAGVHALVDAALEAPGDAAEHVLLAEAQHRLLVGRVEQAGLLVPLVAAGQRVLDRGEQLAGAGPLQDGLDRETGDVAHHAELVEVLELALVVGQQPLGDQLQQDGVVALEGREDVGVGLERGEAVGPEVARAAARLAALLDRPGRVPGGQGLEAGGLGLERRAARPLPAGGRRPEKTSCSSSATSSCAKCSAYVRASSGKSRRWWMP